MNSVKKINWSEPWLVASAVVGLPLLVWIVRLSLTGWVPQGDWAVAAVKTHDAFSEHLQLLGMPSTSANEVAGAAVHHFGPITFQFGWLPYWISGYEPWGILLGSGLLVFVLMAIGLRAAQAVAGLPAVLSLGAVFIALEVALRGFAVTNWNPFPMIFALPTLLVVAAAICSGERRWWPGFIAVASVAAQAHLLGALFAATIVVAVIFLGTKQRKLRLPSKGELGLSVLVLAVCWWAPAMDLVTRDPSNLDQFRTYLTGDRVEESGSINWIVLAGFLTLIWLLVRFRTRSDFGVLHDLTLWGLVVSCVILVVFASRQLYLLMALSIPLLGISLLMASIWPRIVAGRVRLFAVGVFALIVLAAPTTLGIYRALYQPTGQISERVTEALRDMGSTDPVFVDGTGPMASGGIGPGVQAALVADGWFVGRNEFTADPDQAFRSGIRNEAHVLVSIRNLDEESDLPTIPAGATRLDYFRVEHEFQGGGELEIKIYRVD